MNRNMRLYIAAAAIVLCAVVLCLSTSIGQDRRTYEIYSVPVTPSDAARAIGAYERLMERHMDLTERNLTALAADIKAVAAKLDAIVARCEKLDARLARIEKHLGVAPEAPSTPTPDPNASPVPLPAGIPASQPDQP